MELSNTELNCFVYFENAELCCEIDRAEKVNLDD